MSERFRCEALPPDRAKAPPCGGASCSICLFTTSLPLYAAPGGDAHLVGHLASPIATRAGCNRAREQSNNTREHRDCECLTKLLGLCSGQLNIGLLPHGGDARGDSRVGAGHIGGNRAGATGRECADCEHDQRRHRPSRNGVKGARAVVVDRRISPATAPPTKAAKIPDAIQYNKAAVLTVIGALAAVGRSSENRPTPKASIVSKAWMISEVTTPAKIADQVHSAAA